MTTANPTKANARLEEIGREVREAIRSHWILFLIQGVLMVIFGLLAVAEPMFATFAVEEFAGWLFLIGGTIGLVGMFAARRVPFSWWGVINGVLAILIGCYLIWRPLAGVLTLTVAVGAFFAAQGVVQIVHAIGHRSLLRSWGWLLLTGIINLVLALVIISGFPGTAAWTLGLLFGINLFMWGVAWVMMALACRAVPDASQTKKAAA
jgi:uncharacterized membrane protein HdeD (DUF308 family)